MNIDSIAHRDGAGVTMIMGMPRSGTTWLAKILDSHPWTLYRHEPDVNRPPPPAGSGAEALVEFADQMVANRLTRAVGKAPYFPKAYDTRVRRLLRPGLIRAAKVMGRVGGDRTVPDMIPKKDVARVLPVIKSVNISDLLGRLATALPQMRGVGIVRHPCGYAASVLRGMKGAAFSGARPVTDNLEPFHHLLDTSVAVEKGLSMDKLEQMSPAQRLAWLWLASNDRFLGAAQACENVTVIAFEDLCAAPVDESRKLFGFLDLDWDAQTQSFIEASTARDDNAFYSVFKNPQHSAERWRTELDAQAIEEILGVVRGTAIGDRFASD